MLTTGKNYNPERVSKGRGSQASPFCFLFIQFEHREERLRRHLHRAEGAHFLFALLLLLQQLFLARDVAAVALGEHVLAHRLDRLAGDAAPADGGLHRHLKERARNVLLQLFAQLPRPRVRLILVGDEAQRIHLIAV